MSDKKPLELPSNQDIKNRIDTVLPIASFLMVFTVGFFVFGYIFHYLALFLSNFPSELFGHSTRPVAYASILTAIYWYAFNYIYHRNKADFCARFPRLGKHIEVAKRFVNIIFASAIVSIFSHLVGLLTLIALIALYFWPIRKQNMKGKDDAE